MKNHKTGSVTPKNSTGMPWGEEYLEMKSNPRRKKPKALAKASWCFWREEGTLRCYLSFIGRAAWIGFQPCSLLELLRLGVRLGTQDYNDSKVRDTRLQCGGQTECNSTVVSESSVCVHW